MDHITTPSHDYSQSLKTEHDKILSPALECESPNVNVTTAWKKTKNSLSNLSELSAALTLNVTYIWIVRSKLSLRSPP
jgi:hypothetical protein